MDEKEGLRPVGVPLAEISDINFYKQIFQGELVLVFDDTSHTTVIGMRVAIEEPTGETSFKAVPLIVNAPTTRTSAGYKNQIAFDTSYLYICVDTNLWGRTPLDTTTW